MKTHWLQYKDSNVSYLSFDETANGMIHVKGPIGACLYIDEEMTKVEARKYWIKQLSKGYHQITTKDAPNFAKHHTLTYGR